MALCTRTKYVTGATFAVDASLGRLKAGFSYFVTEQEDNVVNLFYAFTDSDYALVNSISSDISGVAQTLYADVNSLLNTEEVSRGVGSVWETRLFKYEEMSPLYVGLQIKTLSGIILKPLPLPGDRYFPDMLGTSDTVTVAEETAGATYRDTPKDIYKGTPAGAVIEFYSREYYTTGIDSFADPTDPASDAGKVLRGAIAGQRFVEAAIADTGRYYGATLILRDGSNTNLLNFESLAGGRFATNSVSDMRLDGNAAGNPTGLACIRVGDIKDLKVEDCNIFNARLDGINCEGNNNQFDISGRVESFNNGRDGFRGAAVGDMQWRGTFIGHSNGRYGFFLGSGAGVLDSVYTYFNALDGIRIDDTVSHRVHIKDIRTEDNDNRGAFLAGRVTIDNLYCPDNGADTTSNSERVGCYLRSGFDGYIGRVEDNFRSTSAIPHNQLRLIQIDAGAKGIIQSVSHGSFGLHGIAGERTIINNSNGLNGLRIINRDCLETAHNGTGTLTIIPDTYEKTAITGINRNVTLNNTSASATNSGTLISLELSVVVDANINFTNIDGAGYFGSDGIAVPAQSLVSGQTLYVDFVERAGNWHVTGSMLIE